MDEDRRAEVEALEAIFGEDCDAREGRISVRLGGGDVWAVFDLPPGYPSEPPAVDITSRGRRVEDRDSLLAACRGAITPGPCVYACVSAANDIVIQEEEEEEAAPQKKRVADDVAAVAAEDVAAAVVVGRKSVYSHHIIAASKRDGLKELSAALGVTVLCKIGWPGALILEGEASRVEEFLAVIRKWRWKHLVVRGEMVDNFHAFSSGSSYVEFCDMADLATECRSVGLEDLFKRLLSRY